MKIAAPERPRCLTTTQQLHLHLTKSPPQDLSPRFILLYLPMKTSFSAHFLFLSLQTKIPPPLWDIFVFSSPLCPGKRQQNDRSDLRPRIALGNLLQRVVRLVWLEGSCLFEGVHQKKSVEWPHAAVGLWEPRIDIHIASGNVILMKDKQTFFFFFFLLLARNV